MIETVDKLSPEGQLKHFEKIFFENAKKAESRSAECAEIKGLIQKHWEIMAWCAWNIRERKLYVIAGFPDRRDGFYAYSQQRLNIGRSQAKQYCSNYERLLLTNSEKADVSAIELPSQRAATEAAKLPEEERQEAVAEAKKSGKITGKSVKAAAKKAASKRAVPERPKDKSGYPIPEHLWTLWNSRGKVKEKIRPLQELKGWVTDMQGTEDPLWNVKGFNLNNLVVEIERVIFHFQKALPDVVCTKCQGINPQCDFCKGRGMISLHLARGVETPIEMKTMRDKITSNEHSSERLSASGR